MYVKFQTEKKGINKLLKNKKSYSLVEADEQLKEFARTLPETKKPNLMMIEIFDGEEDIFRSEFIAGTDASSNLLLLIDELLKTEFYDVSHEESAALLQQITTAYFEEKKGDSFVEQHIDEPLVSQDVEIVIPSLEKKVDKSFLHDEQQPSTEKKKRNKDTTKVRKPAFNRAGFLFQKKVVLPLLVFLLIISSVGLTTYLTKSLNNKSDESYSELYKEERYSDIMTNYPEDEKQLVEDLYSQENGKGLAQIAENNHSDLASFYLNFKNEKWKQVTAIKGIEQDETIQAMRGYAYLKQDKLEEAELINQVIKNETLTEQINQKKVQLAYQELHKKNIEEAEKLNKQVKDSGLSEDIKVAKSIVNLLDKYQKDKDNKDLSETERKEAQENYNQWNDNLNQLGGTKQ